MSESYIERVIRASQRLASSYETCDGAVVVNVDRWRELLAAIDDLNAARLLSEEDPLCEKDPCSAHCREEHKGDQEGP